MEHLQLKVKKIKMKLSQPKIVINLGWRCVFEQNRENNIDIKILDQKIYTWFRIYVLPQDQTEIDHKDEMTIFQKKMLRISYAWDQPEFRDCKAALGGRRVDEQKSGSFTAQGFSALIYQLFGL